jgi:hypothetical protein
VTGGDGEGFVGVPFSGLAHCGDFEWVCCGRLVVKVCEGGFEEEVG